jgi:hypothetical protein
MHVVLKPLFKPFSLIGIREPEQLLEATALQSSMKFNQPSAEQGLKPIYGFIYRHAECHLVAETCSPSSAVLHRPPLSRSSAVARPQLSPVFKYHRHVGF